MRYCNHKHYQFDCDMCKQSLDPGEIEKDKIQFLIDKYEPVLKEVGFSEVCRQMVKDGVIR